MTVAARHLCSAHERHYDNLDAIFGGKFRSPIAYRLNAATG